MGSSRESDNSGLQNDEQLDENPRPRRLMSLDAFRGLTVLLMLLVNNLALGEKTPHWLTHAPWNKGIYLADVVFPWFLFILGVAIPYSAASNKRRGRSFGRFALKAIERTCGLLFLGMLIDSSLARHPVVGLGVLQIIGLAYMVAAILYILPPILRLVTALVLLLAHWWLLRFFQIPGVGAGVMTESANAVAYLNRTYLQAYHLSGIVSILPTSALAMIGSVIGDFLLNDAARPKLKVVGILAGGAVMVGAGLLWCIDLPINKSLWTASFILITAGVGSAVLSMMYLVIDVKSLKPWALPIVVFGMNALVGYVAPILMKAYILLGWTCGLPGGGRGSLHQAMIQYFKLKAGEVSGGWIYTSVYIVFWWLVLLYMYRKRWFLKV